MRRLRIPEGFLVEAPQDYPEDWSPKFQSDCGWITRFSPDLRTLGVEVEIEWIC